MWYGNCLALANVIFESRLLSTAVGQSWVAGETRRWPWRGKIYKEVIFVHFIDANWFVVTGMNCPCFSPWQQKSDEILFPWKGSIKKIWKFCHDLQLGGSRVLFMIFKKKLFLNQCGITRAGGAPPHNLLILLTLLTQLMLLALLLLFTLLALWHICLYTIYWDFGSAGWDRWTDHTRQTVINTRAPCCQQC